MRDAQAGFGNLTKAQEPPGQPRARRKGQSLIEFALTVPIALLLIFGIIDIARLMQAKVSVSNAARQGLRYAITGQQEKDVNGVWITRTVTIKQKAVDGLSGLTRTNTNDPSVAGFNEVDVNPPDGGGPHDAVEVTVYYNIQMLTPLVNMIIPNVLVRGFERGINEQWGAVQSFDHANIPPTPPPLPTWTALPTSTATPTSTAVPTNTRTATPTNTQTATPTRTATPSNTVTPVPSATPTQTPTP